MGVTNLSETGIRVIVAGADVFDRQADRVEKAINDINKAASNAGKGFGGFSISLTKIGGALTSIGTSLTKNITLPLIGANAALTAFGIEFEDAFAGATKTLNNMSVGFDEVAESIYGTSKGLSDAQKEVVFADERFGELTEQGKEFQRWIRDTTLDIPIAATELARIAQLAGQLGVQIGEDGATDDIEKFVKAMALVTVATDYTADQAATDFAQLANVVGVPLEDIADFTVKAANAVVALGNNFAATEPDIVSMSLRFGGFASAIGVLPEEILAISAAVLSSGVKVEAGGTAIARIFEEMTFAVNDYTIAGKETAATSAQIESDLTTLEQLLASGMSWDEINLAMEGTSLELAGMSKYVNNLGDDFTSLDNIIETVRNNTETKLIKALNKGTITNKEYNRSIKNMEGDLANLRFTIQSGQRDVSEINVAFADSDLVLSGLQSQLNSLDKEYTSVGDVINIVRQQSLSKMNKDLAEGTEQLDLFAKATGLSQKALTELIKQDPDVAFFKIVEGLNRMNEEGTLSSDVLQTLGLDSSRLKQLLFGLGQNQELYTRALTLTNEEWEDQVALQEEAEKRFKTTKSLIILVKNAFQELGFILFDLQKKNIEATLNKVRDLILRFKDLDESTQRLIVTVGGIAAAIGPTLIILGQFIKYIGLSTSSIKLATNVLIKQFIPTLLSLAAPLLLIGALMGGVYLAFKNNFANIQGILKKFERALDFAGITGPLEGFIEALKKGDLETAINALQEAISNTFLALQDPKFLETIKTLFKKFVSNVGKEIEDAFDNFQKDIPNLPSKITRALYPTFAQVFGPKLGKEIIKQLRFGINYALEVLEAVISPIVTGINAVFKQLEKGDYKKAFIAFKKIFVHIFDNLRKTDFIKELSGIIQEVINKTFEDVENAYKNPSESGLYQVIADIISTAFTEGTKALGIEEEAQKVINKISNIFDDISPYLPLIIDPLVKGISDLVEGIIGFFIAFEDVDPSGLFILAGAIVVLIANLVGAVLSGVGAALPPLGEAIESFITTISLLVDGKIGDAIYEFSLGLESLNEAIRNFNVSVTGDITEFLRKVGEIIGSGGFDNERLDSIVNFFVLLGEAAVGLLALSKVAGWLASLGSSAVGAAASLGSVAGPLLIVTGILLSLQNNTFGVVDSWEEFRQKVGENDWVGAVGSALETFQRLVLGIPTNLAQVFFDIVGWNVDVEAEMRAWGDRIKLLWEGIKTFISGKWEELKTNVSNRWNEMSDSVTNRLNNLNTDLTSRLNTMSAFITGVWEGIKTKAGEKVDEIVNFFTGLPNRILNAITSAYTSLLLVGTELAKPIVEGMKQGLKAVITALNNVLPNKIDFGSVDIPYVGSFSISLDLPDNPFPIPNFRRGGRMRGPGIVGEQGPELFMPDTSGFIVNNNILKSLISLLSPLASPSTSNITNSNMFAPTVYGVPMTNEQSMNDSILDLYWATQT